MSEIPIRRVSEPYDGRLSRTVRRALRRQGLIITSYRSSTLSIMVFSSILFLKIGDLNLTSYYLYRYAFFFTFYFYWLISSVVNFSLLALCYHMSNGIRHLLWDLGFFLELSKVYTSGIIMLFCATFLAVSNIIRFYFS
jgi:succinate dehydrogenase / fumarate reductase cytochrome b subunit